MCYVLRGTKIPAARIIASRISSRRKIVHNIYRHRRVYEAIAASLLAACGLLAGQTGAWAQAQSGDATTYTQQTFYDWVSKYKDAKPEFKAGDVLTNADLEKARPFMMPGYFEQYVKSGKISRWKSSTPIMSSRIKMVLDCNEKVPKASEARRGRCA